ncbi:hypothetical protein C8F01DRAFT_1088561 [Mycena amicta]|nr:hypothetical protein C8F01DRAFT_1088561 [Mycena amicta]
MSKHQNSFEFGRLTRYAFDPSNSVIRLIRAYITWAGLGQGWWALHIERMVLRTLSRTGSGLHSPKTPRANRSALLAIASLERLLGVYTIEPAVSAGSRSPTGCESGWSGSTTEVRSLEPDGVEMRQARMGSPIRDCGE